MRKASLWLFLILGLPLLLSGCKVVVRGYTNTSGARVFRGSTGLNLRIQIALSRHRALQSSLSRAGTSARSMRRRTASLAEDRAEEMREVVRDEAEKEMAAGTDESREAGKRRRYPS